MGQIGRSELHTECIIFPQGICQVRGCASLLNQTEHGNAATFLERLGQAEGKSRNLFSGKCLKEGVTEEPVRLCRTMGRGNSAFYSSRLIGPRLSTSRPTPSIMAVNVIFVNPSTTAGREEST